MKQSISQMLWPEMVPDHLDHKKLGKNTKHLYTIQFGETLIGNK